MELERHSSGVFRKWQLLFLPALLLPLFLILHSHKPGYPSPHAETTTTDALLSALDKRTVLYKQLSDTIVYNSHARVYSRKIEFPSKKTFTFDVWGRVWRSGTFAVVTVVPFEPATQTFTMVREYSVAHGVATYNFPQGQVEGKHGSVRDAAERELQEEAGLAGGDFFGLVEQGMPQDKYQRERVFVFLCVGAKEVVQGERDREESIEIVRGVTTRQILDLAMKGVIQSNQVAAGLLAINRLRRMKLLYLTSLD